jgi:hypothetical protein
MRKSRTSDTPEKNEVQSVEVEPQEEDKKTIPILWAESPIPESIENEHDAREKRAEFRDRCKLVFEGLTLLVVAGYGLVAYLQWGEMIMANGITKQAAEAATSSARTAREALEITEAADVGLDTIQCGTGVGADTIMTLRFKNNGRTRATEFYSRWGYDIGDIPHSEQWIIGPASEAVITAGAIQESTAPETIGNVAGPDRMLHILDGTLSFGFSGQFSYMDVFSKPHMGTFQYRYQHGTPCLFYLLKASSK